MAFSFFPSSSFFSFRPSSFYFTSFGRPENAEGEAEQEAEKAKGRRRRNDQSWRGTNFFSFFFPLTRLFSLTGKMVAEGDPVERRIGATKTCFSPIIIFIARAKAAFDTSKHSRLALYVATSSSSSHKDPHLTCALCYERGRPRTKEGRTMVTKGRKLRCSPSFLPCSRRWRKSYS